MNTPAGFRTKRLEELDAEPDGTAILRVISWGERGLGAKQVAMSMSVMKPGQSIVHHKHPEREEVYILLRGKSQVFVEDEKPIDAEAYQFFLFDKGTMHSVSNNTQEDAHWLFVSRALDL